MNTVRDEYDIREGETWRRKKDGKLVKVTSISQPYGGINPWSDVKWKRTETTGHGVAFAYNFIRLYERVEES